jgi:DNA polymerase III alpha subunit
MGLNFRYVLLLSSLLLGAPALHAQIYTCVGADGSRVFSDKKCGKDAKPVKGFEKTKTKSLKAAKQAAQSKVATPPKSAQELGDLLQVCNAGDEKACTEWTMGGGPAALREAEHQSELACEAGSLSDCEQRYCKEGATEKCRQSVLRSAELSGDNWYLRSTDTSNEDGAQKYAVRCIRKDVGETRDVTITCAIKPKRYCYADKSDQQFAGIKQGATALCATK